jgi:hypothetical protein
VRISSWRLVLGSTAVVACTDAAPPPARTDAAALPAATPVRDSTWVDVTGPTLIAFLPPNAGALLDSAGDAATALDDFGYYLASASDSLRALGVRVVSVESRTLHVVVDGRTTVFRVARDSADLGYYLVAPGRAAVVRYGAQTDADLIDAVREHLLQPRTSPGATPAP